MTNKTHNKILVLLDLINKLEIKIENTRNKCESTNRENTFMRGFLSGLEYSLECTESELYLIELNKGGK